MGHTTDLSPLTYMALGNSMARLAGVWMEMVWPLDEGAAVPLCVRTVDQGAPDGGLMTELSGYYSLG
jgi:hypothetical protein